MFLGENANDSRHHQAKTQNTTQQHQNTTQTKKKFLQIKNIKTNYYSSKTIFFNP